MENYTVLLVDDEEDVIQVMMRKVNWEEIGFSVIGYAGNGVKALEMVEKFQPDVVVTDIRMPYMDGIELAGHIKAEYPATKLLIFTGFDEFEYAKEAVHLEVEEYLLKPVNSTELTTVFSRLKEKLDREISEKRDVEGLKKYYMESLPVLRANFYTLLIEGKLQEDEAKKYAADYQISFSGPYYCCLVLHASSSHIPENMNPLLMQASVEKQAREYFRDRWRAGFFSYLGNTVMLAELGDKGEVTELTDECDRFCRYAGHMLGTDVTIGIGDVCSNILELSDSYSGAREAVSYRVIYGASKAINIKEIVPGKVSDSGSGNDRKLARLFKNIRFGSGEDVVASVNEYMTNVVFPAKSLPQYIDVMELAGSLWRFAVNNDIADEELSEAMRRLYANMTDMDPETLREQLVDISFSLRERLLNTRNKLTKSFVSKAQEYVRSNYGDASLSLNSICEALGVSNAYFSTVFKKETGNTFIGWLTDYRMEQASRLLVETNEKSYIIAERVGYTDPNYFSYVFKRRFGVSPSKYRMGHMESEK
ncbi:MAG: response regulator [Lachnospiraceae bacterium]|nr:response regulator [Lachnospiraceae bacterium]MBO5146194.1 response regulator [Lachnospiraceae bacterium]